MTVNLLSFGFRYGLPYDADLVMDVRFLPNPYFIEKLKSLNGENKEVSDYVLKRSETKKFIKKFSNLIYFLFPLYEKEGKFYLTIAIGCTGGKHRSVVLAEKINEYLNLKGYSSKLFHKDIGRSNE